MPWALVFAFYEIFGQEREFGSPNSMAMQNIGWRKLGSHPHQSESSQVRFLPRETILVQKEESEMFEIMLPPIPSPVQNENKTLSR